MQTIFFDISNKYAVSMEPKPEGGKVALQFKQGNVGQKIKAVIMNQENAYSIPNGAQFSVWFSGPSGEGNYSAIGDRSAFQVEGNAVTVEVISQMLINPGNGTLCLVLNSADGSQIGLWNVIYAVEHVPGMGSKAAENYYTALSELARQAIDAASTFVTDATLSTSGKAADAAAVGAGLAGKAPAGYGLGGTAKLLTSADDLFAQPNGNYAWYSDTPANAPSFASNGWSYARVDLSADSFSKRVTVWTYQPGYERAAQIAVRTEGIWQPWEWVDPPMYPGVEYRTTERWYGYTVYTKLIDYGNIGSGYSILSTGCGNRVVRAAVTHGAGIVPFDGVGAINNSYTTAVGIDKDTLHFYAAANVGTANLSAQLWYIKD